MSGDRVRAPNRAPRLQRSSKFFGCGNTAIHVFSRTFLERVASPAFQLGYHLAKKAGNAELVENHHAFWRDEATMSEGSPPAILDRGDKVHLPPALVFGGDSDEWVPVETMQRLVAGWKKAGGDIELQFYKGANHGFMTGKPDAPYARPAIERMKAFIRAHTG